MRINVLSLEKMSHKPNDARLLNFGFRNEKAHLEHCSKSEIKCK